MEDERRQPPDWAEARRFFLRDGMLRDVQCDASLDAWRSWLLSLAEQPWLREYRLANRIISPVFEYPRIDQDADCPVLTITLATGPTLQSSFFDPDEVDFDLAPEEFASEAQWQELLEFMALLGGATGAEVRLSPEGAHDHPWLVYRPHQHAWATIGEPDDHIIKDLVKDG